MRAPKEKTVTMIMTDLNVPAVGYRREIAALRLGISLRSLDQLLAEGRLASIRVGKRVLISEQAIADFVRRAETKAKV